MANAAKVRSERARSWRRAPLAVLRRLGAVLALLAMCAILTALSDHFLTFDNLMNVFRQSAVNALLALGQLLVIVTAGIDLSVGSVLGFACVVAALMMKAGVPAWVSIAGGHRRWNGPGKCKRTDAHRASPASSIHTHARDDECRARARAGNFRGLSDIRPTRRVSAGWAPGKLAYIPAPVLVVLVVCVVLHLFLTRTTVGRDIYAIGGNKQAAVLCGIPVNSRLTLVYAISGGLAGLAAILLAGRMNSGYPLAGAGAELDSIAAVIIGGASFFGGVGTVSGTLVGALMIGVLRNGLNLLDVSSYWQSAVIGVVIVMAVWIDVVRQRSASKNAR